MLKQTVVVVVSEGDHTSIANTLNSASFALQAASNILSQDTSRTMPKRKGTRGSLKRGEINDQLQSIDADETSELNSPLRKRSRPPTPNPSVSNPQKSDKPNDSQNTLPKRRGRPVRAKITDTNVKLNAANAVKENKQKNEDTIASTQINPPKKRGRPPRAKMTTTNDGDVKLTSTDVTTKVKDETVDSEIVKDLHNTNVDPCPICYEEPLHPFKLPCNHTYCFLCAKGVSESMNVSPYVTGDPTCAICRRPFSKELFRNPQFCDSASSSKIEGMCWYYQGRKAWWKFDARNSEDIETAFQTGVEKHHMLICGKMFVIDFKNMVQYQRDGNGRVRVIKRDNTIVNVQGVAGLVFNNQ